MAVSFVSHNSFDCFKAHLLNGVGVVGRKGQIIVTDFGHSVEKMFSNIEGFDKIAALASSSIRFAQFKNPNSVALNQVQGSLKGVMQLIKATSIFKKIAQVVQLSLGGNPDGLKDAHAWKLSSYILMTGANACDFFAFTANLGYDRFANLSNLTGQTRVFGSFGEMPFPELKKRFVFGSTIFSIGDTLRSKVIPNKWKGTKDKVKTAVGLVGDFAKLGLVTMGTRYGSTVWFNGLAFAAALTSILKSIVDESSLF
ncbi:MAG: hypothetical protein K0S07_1308, partial [Chlamydiales bacterium]|nr:hypothetical protein [Chlamydiales bacterium]